MLLMSEEQEMTENVATAATADVKRNSDFILACIRSHMAQ